MTVYENLKEETSFTFLSSISRIIETSAGLIIKIEFIMIMLN